MNTRLILVLPHHLGHNSDDSIIQAAQAVMDELAIRSIASLVNFPVAGTDLELSCLGLNPEDHPVSEGVVRSHGLPFDVGTKSIFFGFDLISLQEDESIVVPPGPIPVESLWLAGNLTRLSSKRLQVEYDSGLLGAIHWREGSLEHRTVPAPDIMGKKWRECLPEGDGESMLRQWIDDSANLLMEAEFNRIRFQEGIPVISMAWPWGGGRGVKLPNLPLNLKCPVSVHTDSPRLLKLARMTGCNVLDLGNVWANPVRLSVHEGVTIVTLTSFVEARQLNRAERMEELWNRIADSLIGESMKLTKVKPREISIIGSNPNQQGLCVTWSSEVFAGDRVPYHERVLGDPTLPSWHLWEHIRALSTSSS